MVHHMRRNTAIAYCALRIASYVLEQWLAEHEYESISQLKGSVSQQHAIDPSAYERTNYVQVLDSYSSPAGVLR